MDSGNQSGLLNMDHVGTAGHKPYLKTDEELGYDPMDVDQVREYLKANNEMAVDHLCWAILDHACDIITHSDEKLHRLNSRRREVFTRGCEQVGEVRRDAMTWMMAHPVKASFMIFGFGGAVFKAKTMKEFLVSNAEGFIDWGKSSGVVLRFFGFVMLMTVRLIVSTVIPPTSPAFALIIQAATPGSQKWTAMPFFLAASTIAGAAPYLMDRILALCFQRDFVYTNFMKRFADFWPLTCWTGPTMIKVFQNSGGGKLGASFAVIFAHAAPFMGAQTTNLQRYFLPHPLDTIISQPFGMSEDLVLMALAEATTNPKLASVSLSGIIVIFNLLQYSIFSGGRDLRARAIAVVNVVAGLFFMCLISTIEGSNAICFGITFLQMLVQLFAAPAFTSNHPSDWKTALGI